MSRILWIPQQDRSMDHFSSTLIQKDSKNTKEIDRGDGESLVTSKHNRATWSDVVRDTQLTILGHGAASSTQKIAWVGAKGTVYWTYQELAKTLVTNLKGPPKFPLTIELLMCWGADGMLWKDAFVARFAAKIADLGCSGTVKAYKGGVVMGAINARADDVIIQGKSRIGSAFNNQDLNKIREATTDSTVKLWNFFNGSEVEKTLTYGMSS
ncbi:MAG: hypothetical protein N2C14_24895 [Planctomycetales bacterium]